MKITDIVPEGCAVTRRVALARIKRGWEPMAAMITPMMPEDE